MTQKKCGLPHFFCAKLFYKRCKHCVFHKNPQYFKEGLQNSAGSNFNLFMFPVTKVWYGKTCLTKKAERENAPSFLFVMTEKNGGETIYCSQGERCHVSIDNGIFTIECAHIHRAVGNIIPLCRKKIMKIDEEDREGYFTMCLIQCDVPNFLREVQAKEE